MTYEQFQPHPALAPYIDAYWIAACSGPFVRNKVLPDGCVDIIISLGADCYTGNDGFVLQHEQAYFVGTMTRAKDTCMNEAVKLLGVRFMPGAFSVFYNYASLHETTDQIVAFEKKMTPCLKAVMQHPVAALDRFFLEKLAKPKHALLPVIAAIQHKKGQVQVAELARQHFITGRQLERHFKQHIGVPPKEFINLVRYQQAMQEIKHNATGRSLADIAFDCGYYDHAHLSNEIKRYTGTAPSLL